MMLAALLPLLMQAASVPAPAPAPPSTPTPVPWSVAHTTANGAPATSTSVWSADGTARLVVRCDTATSPIVSIQFIPKPGFAAASPRPVSINADDNGWLGTNWQFPGNGAFVSDDVIVTNLTAAVAHARSIRVHVIDPDNGVVEAVFAGPPADTAIRTVLGACGYELGKVPLRSLPPPVPKATAAPAPDDE